MRRILETAGLFTIAAALHVSAAAIMLPEQLKQGEPTETPSDAPSAAVAAGGAEIEAMVEAWDAPPKAEIVQDLPAPLAQPEAAPDQPAPAPEAPPPPLTAPAMAQPVPAPARPNLPEPPAPPRINPAQLDLPELRDLSPPQVQPRLALDASARPERRPDRRQARAAPQPQAQPQAQPQQPARQSQAGSSQSTPQAGSGGVSASERASLMSQWGAQIRSCINRSARAPRGLRGGGQVVLSLSIGRDGAVRGVGLAASSGQPALDQAATEAARRAGRCPAAPAGLAEPAYAFELPISLASR